MTIQNSTQTYLELWQGLNAPSGSRILGNTTQLSTEINGRWSNLSSSASMPRDRLLSNLSSLMSTVRRTVEHSKKQISSPTPIRQKLQETAKLMSASSGLRATSRDESWTGAANASASNTLVSAPPVTEVAPAIGSSSTNARLSHSHLFWRNYQTGQNAVWTMNGSTFVEGVYLNSTPDLNWQMEGTADFNSDGYADILWRNRATGENVAWLMQGSTYLSATSLMTVLDLNWQIEGTTDFNSDGYADILWRNHATGENVTWLMQGSTYLSATSLMTVSDLNWQMEGTTDFNSDGYADILWRNYRTGENVAWLMQGTTYVNSSYLQPLTEGGWQSICAGDWFSRNLRNPGVRSVVRSLGADGQLSRSDLLTVFGAVGSNGLIEFNELTDLRSLINQASYLGMSDAVRVLTSKVVNGDWANQFYQGASLGNLFAGTSANHLEKLVGKWFYGNDRPIAKTYDGTLTFAYQYASGSLFQNGVSYQDVAQGIVGDCYYLAGLAETAYRRPDLIQSMFIDNGDNTYTVRFFNQGVADYVTVDRYLPMQTDGRFIFAHPVEQSWGYYNNPANELWVALAEKAYAQLNQSGWIRQDNSNSFQGIHAGYIGDALSHITGARAAIGTYLRNDVESFKALTSAFNAGKLIGFCSQYDSQVDATVVPIHAYALVGYDAATQEFTLFNPWGTATSSPYSGILRMNWNQLLKNFLYWDSTI